MNPFLFRFDNPRPSQTKMMQDIYTALCSKRSILINAPTGVGKTDAALGSTLTYAMENNLNIFFLTPKISQHRIAVDVLSGLRKRYSLDITYADMVGKQNLCVNPEVNYLERDAFYKSCEMKVKGGKCRYYNKARDQYADNVPQALTDASLEGHGALFAASYDHGACAYEVAAYLAKKSKVIIADYAHMLNPYTRQAFLKRIGQSLTNSIVIWDEAHNIVETANSYLSSSLTTNTIDNASKELGSIESQIDLEYLKFALKKIAAKALTAKEEAFVKLDDMPEEITQNIEGIVEQLEKAGLEYAEKSKAKRSALMHVARFLSMWKQADESVARMISKQGSNIRLLLSCLYPEKSLDVMQESYANVFMSATLLPLKMYAELFKLQEASLRTYDSSFPSGNKIALIDDSVTTKYESRSIEEYKKISARISAVKRNIKGNIAVFFPSFDFLESVHRYMGNESVYLQRRDMKSAAIENLLKEFKNSEESMLFGVMGGSLSEGIDFANNIIKGIIVVGIPLGKPDLATSARIEYLNKRFTGKGIEYAYTIPAIIRAVQAAGRAVRSEKDRAVIVFMDKRYRWGLYSSLIRNSIPLVFEEDALKSIREFSMASQGIG